MDGLDQNIISLKYSYYCLFKTNKQKQFYFDCSVSHTILVSFPIIVKNLSLSENLQSWVTTNTIC